jgi:hypothetical protein
VGEHHGHRPLADGAGDPLGRPVADVARREQPGHARLQGERVAVERPAGGALAVLEQVRAGENVAARVGAHAAVAVQPVRGCPPMQTKRARAGSVSRSTVTAASCPSCAWTAVTWHPRRTSISGCSAMRLSR